MNAISSDQNQPRQLERLAAQRHLYSKAKFILGLQLLIAGPLTILFAFSVAFNPDLKSYTALWGVVASLLDLILLTPWQKRLRTSAAQIQELFDCDVLCLPWNEIKVGRKPDPELIKENAAAYSKSASSMPSLSDWYPTQVAALPIHVARAICQRANCWWDAKQRRRFAAGLISIVTFIFSAVLFIALRKPITLEVFFLQVFLPLSPLLILGYRQYVEHTEAAARLDSLKDHTMKTWNASLNHGTESDVENQQRVIQGEIFDCRKKNPLIFDFLFRWFRDRYEQQMNHAADELVAEAKERLEAHET